MVPYRERLIAEWINLVAYTDQIALATDDRTANSTLIKLSFCKNQMPNSLTQLTHQIAQVQRLQLIRKIVPTFHLQLLHPQTCEGPGAHTLSSSFKQIYPFFFFSTIILIKPTVSLPPTTCNTFKNPHVTPLRTYMSVPHGAAKPGVTNLRVVACGGMQSIHIVWWWSAEAVEVWTLSMARPFWPQLKQTVHGGGVVDCC